MSVASVSSSEKPRRRRPNDRSEVAVSFLPEGNWAAKWGYVCMMLGLIPGVGVVTGWLAVLLGAIGFFKAKKDTEKRGIGHAVVSMVLGLLEVIAQGVGWWLLLG